jgi:hypothetical protein
MYRFTPLSYHKITNFHLIKINLKFILGFILNLTYDSCLYPDLDYMIENFISDILEMI